MSLLEHRPAQPSSHSFAVCEKDRFIPDLCSGAEFKLQRSIDAKTALVVTSQDKRPLFLHKIYGKPISLSLPAIDSISPLFAPYHWYYPTDLDFQSYLTDAFDRGQGIVELPSHTNWMHLRSVEKSSYWDDLDFTGNPIASIHVTLKKIEEYIKTMTENPFIPDTIADRTSPIERSRYRLLRSEDIANGIVNW